MNPTDAELGGTPKLVERDEELRRIGLALERAAAGRGSLLVIEGPAGIGKSHLLSEACTLAGDAGMRVLRARGGVLERDVAFGAVRLLLERPLGALTAADRAEVMGEAAALARPALAVAGAEERAPPDRAFAVLHGLYWCVANLADRGPLLLALDDAHWFDAASLRFVHYLARRVADVPVAMMVATRQAEHGAEAALAQQLTLEPAAEVLRPAPLTAEGVAAVIAQRMARTVAPEFGAACHAAVGGNAFLLTELLGALVADGVDPTAQSAARIRDVRPPALSRSILLRMGRMPAGAAELAAAVAVIGDRASLAEAALLASQDEPTATAAFDHLAAAEILAPTLPAGFVHPLVRELVYDDLGPAQRAQWHARAAKLILATGGSLERAASHLLSTTPTARRETVTVLRRAARGALDRGAAEVAVRYLARALAEPPPQSERGMTLLELGGAEALTGEQTEAAKRHLGEAIGLIADTSTRAQAWLLLARVTVTDASASGAAGVLQQALADVGTIDDELRERLETDLDTFAINRPQTVARSGARIDALAVPVGQTAAERLTLCNLAARSCFTGRSAAQTVQLTERALAGGRLVTDKDTNEFAQAQLIYVLTLADRPAPSADLCELLLASARARGWIQGVAGATAARGATHWHNGNLTDSEVDGRQALATPGLPPLMVPFASAFVCLALVERGALEEAEAIVAASGCGPTLPESLHRNLVFWARGRLRIAQGRLAEGLDDLLEFGRRSDALQLSNPAIPWRADAALVHARLGHSAAALRLASQYDELARAWGTAHVIGISARTQGLMEGGAGGLRLLHDAVDAHETCPAHLERARSLLEFGAALRRAGRRSDAIEPLRRATDLARRCRAPALASRAAEELRVAGAVGRRHAFSGADDLTPSERRVARMAAGGLSNRDIAQELFVTAKTVENHLGRVYIKLGIGSRTQLPDALGESAGSADLPSPETLH